MLSHPRAKVKNNSSRSSCPLQADRAKGTEMTSVFVSTVINAPIERVWRCVSDFNGLPAWMPGMKDSTIEPGKGEKDIGAVRSLTMAGSRDKLRERLEALSPDEFLITYSVLEGPLPVKNIRTSMRLRPITDAYGTFAEWTSEFRTEKGKEEEGAQFMSRVFNAGFRALKRHLGV
jgi:uncharacterized protein YndB with AHSA1/START domain